jgi:hypothetical protein
MLFNNNKILLTSPDYIIDKSQVLLGMVGKTEFIQYPKYWQDYCDTWHTEHENYELMNIINFLSNIYPPYIPNEDDEKKELHPKITFNNFEKFIGLVDNIQNNNMIHLAHFIIREQVELYINDNCYSRYLKLKSI